MGANAIVSINIDYETIGEIKVFDPIYSNHKFVMKRTITKSLQGYFMQNGLDAVRDGGMVIFEYHPDNVLATSLINNK